MNKNKTTIITLRKHKEKKQKTVIITAYDYPQALIADSAGVDVILIGDSIGMTTLGHKTTIPVTMEDMIRATESVVRANKSSFIVADMPFMSYQISNEEAVINAGKFTRAGADCVKVEGIMYDRIKAIVDSDILVMSHLGLTPQSRAKLGGYRVQGKTAKEVEVLLEQALKLQEIGCCSILLEAVPMETAQVIAENLHIPVYGVGAGNAVDGQLVIFHDLVGLFWDFKSKFVKKYCDAGELMKNAIQEYAKEVRDQDFPTEENFYLVKEGEIDKIESMLADSKWKYEEK
jgi:3-methyl-2-oxobutanoate hydroxymethyltransferase